MILLMQQQGAVNATFEDACDFVKDPGVLFYVTNLNVVLVFIADVVLFGMLYLYFEPAYPVLSLCGVLFVPVYASYIYRIKISFRGVFFQSIIVIFAFC